MGMASIVVCDTETSGLSPTQHRILEVALARVDNGEWGAFQVETFRINLTEREYACGESGAYQINGYRLGHPDWEGAPECDSPGAVEVYEKIAQRLRKAPLVNQRVNFDAAFLLEELCRHGVTPPGLRTPYGADGDKKNSPWEGNIWNVEAFSRALMKKAGLKGWKLHTVYEDVCHGPELPPHRGESDVLRALWVMAEGRRRCPEIWPDFHIDSDAISTAVEKWAKERLVTTYTERAETPAGVLDMSKGGRS